MAARVLHQYPLRAGAWLAQVQVPPDMTIDEAYLLCEFVYSLVGNQDKPAAVTQARAENRFFAETRPERAKAVKLWRVRFEVITQQSGYKPRTHVRCLLVSAAHEHAAVEEARPHALNMPHEVMACRWLSTELADLPVDLSEIETPATARAGGRGYQQGMVAGFRFGYLVAVRELEAFWTLLLRSRPSAK